MARILKNELLHKELSYLKATINSGLPADTIIETLSKTLNIPILEISAQITILEFSKLSEYSLHGYFICKDSAGQECFVISNPLLLANKKLYKSYRPMLIKNHDFYAALERAFSGLNTQKALLELGFMNPQATARNVNYTTTFVKMLGIMTMIGYISNTIFIAINYLIYLSQTLFKMWLFADTYFDTSSIEKTPKKRYKNYPKYSILVPMYREEHGVKSILHALNQLNYPRNRLDIKLVVEDDDEISLKILNMIALPEHVHVIKVPYSEPRTKPKALNYAMQYIKGEYVVIYDVEDRPDTDQLLKALEVFENSTDNVICVQAKLNFYNRNSSLLSRLCSIEYSIWFKFLLPGLDSSHMPIPLGGNSNHFRADGIRKIGLWDAYNVTEDADLGVRIFMYGYQTRVIESYTMEEAPTDIKNWIHQRARWIKGFMQTFLVYWGQTSELQENISLPGKVGIYLFLGFATYSFFIMPWHFAAICFNLSRGNYFLAELSGYMTMLYMYFTSSVIIINDTNYFRNAKLLDWIVLLIWPFYFALHIIASYKALWELVVRPFSWNKTSHALSKEQKSISDA